mgnify:CR=1 FL=1
MKGVSLFQFQMMTISINDKGGEIVIHEVGPMCMRNCYYPIYVNETCSMSRSDRAKESCNVSLLMSCYVCIVLQQYLFI